MTDTESTLFMEHDAILDLIDGMADVLQKHLTARALDNPAIIGIHTGGTWVAQRLQALLDVPSRPACSTLASTATISPRSASTPR